jgi:hypothetical protein
LELKRSARRLNQRHIFACPGEVKRRYVKSLC